jgi:hypothetical protein
MNFEVSIDFQTYTHELRVLPPRGFRDWRVT